MDVREFVINSVSRVRQFTLQTVEALSREDMLWQPAPFANPVGFLLFHIFRTEDQYLSRWLGATGEVWEQQGWNRRWKLPAPPPDAPEQWTTGFSWTPEQVGGWEPPPKEELMEYGQQVRESTLKVIQQFDLSKLTQPANPDRPNMTYASYMHQISNHEAQHQAQIDYVLGLRQGRMGV